MLTPLSIAAAAQVSLQATRDNSMYAEAPGNSNGRGDHFITGKTGGNTGLRRALVAFDLAAIPANSRIDRVALELRFQGTTNMENDPRLVSLHRVLSNWGEGTSDSGPGGSSGAGNGAVATTNDTTWRHRFFNTETWSSYDPAVAGSGGGDFASQSSGDATVGIVPDVLVTWEALRLNNAPAVGMIADVEHWLSNPSSNFGWLLKLADESPLRTARRFYSKDAANAAFHPRLVVDYTVVPEPTTRAILVMGVLSACCAARARHLRSIA
jgi:hypothetical protein